MRYRPRGGAVDFLRAGNTQGALYRALCLEGVTIFISLQICPTRSARLRTMYSRALYRPTSHKQATETA